ncbi:hypothetical protein RhiJN_27151 [Ceratobasidium sp. AG-Ba]|nr:hypothetical protein RhiJN_27151 [Ceratobasidium sp. AG-Ba]
MYNTLFDSGVNRRYMLVSDFCNAGGYYGLRYYLCLKDEPKWVESKYWNKKTPNCHAIHFAGAGRSQNTHEGDTTGGYFTYYVSLSLNFTLSVRLSIPTSLHRLGGIPDSAR